MSTPIAVPRTAPIPIASKPASFRKPDFNERDDVKPKSSAPGSARNSPKSAPGRKTRPCDACRRRKSKCVVHEGQVVCVLCQFHKQDCTFVQSPQPRKRKLVVEKKEEPIQRRRYVKNKSVIHSFEFNLCSIVAMPQQLSLYIMLITVLHKTDLQKENMT